MVEQWTFNPSVAGSIPAGPTKISYSEDWLPLSGDTPQPDQMPHMFPTSDVSRLTNEVIYGLGCLALHPLQEVPVDVQRERG